MLPAVQLQGINRFNMLTAGDHRPEVNVYEHTNQLWKCEGSGNMLATFCSSNLELYMFT